MSIYRIVYENSDVWIPGEKDVVSPKVEIELNTAGRLTFTLTPDHPNYHTIQPLIGTIEVYENSDLIWFGRAISMERDIKNQKPVYCEGALAYFNDSAQEPREIASTDVQTLLESIVDAHNAQVPSNRQFAVGTVESIEDNISWSNSYTSTLSVLTNLLGRVGGYFIPRRANGLNTLDFIKELPLDYYQAIEYGVNMTAFKREYTFAERVTAVLPLGGTAEGQSGPTTIASVNDGDIILDGDEVSRFGRIVKVINFSEIDVPGALKSAAEIYLENAAYNPINISAKAVDLSFVDAQYHPFRVGNQYCVYSIPHEVHEYLPLVKLGISMDTAVREIELSSERDIASVDIRKFTLISMCGDLELKRRVYHFPVGYEYSIELQNITVYSVDGEIIYTPIEPIVSGTMSSQDETYTAYYLGKYILTIIAKFGGMELERFKYRYYGGDSFSVMLEDIEKEIGEDTVVYTPITSMVTGVMPFSNYSVIAEYTRPFTLTVVARFGFTELERFIYEYYPGDEYSIVLTDIVKTDEGETITYHPVDSQITGTMPAANSTIYAEYSGPYVLTLIARFGFAELERHIYKYYAGDSYTISLGEIARIEEGENVTYYPVQSSISGTMPSANTTILAEYTRLYALNIIAKYGDDELQRYTYSYYAGETYTVNLPRIVTSGGATAYYPIQDTFSGIMPNANKTITAQYDLVVDDTWLIVLNDWYPISNKSVLDSIEFSSQIPNADDPGIMGFRLINTQFNSKHEVYAWRVALPNGQQTGYYGYNYEGGFPKLNSRASYQNGFAYFRGLKTVNFDNVNIYTMNNCVGMFEYCSNYNDKPPITENITGCSQMFDGCTNFNQPVNIPDGVTGTYSMFAGCTMLNQPITFGNNVTSMSYVFSGCKNFNSPITVKGDLVQSMAWAFVNCTNFNQPIYIGNNVVNCISMFTNCNSFNQPVVLPESLVGCTYMFDNCHNFNQPVSIKNNITNCDNMFRYCIKLNCEVTLGQNVKSCNNMFYYASAFNQPVVIPDNVVYCNSMFLNSGGSSSVVIGNNVKYAYQMFKNSKFNSPITIPESVTECWNMFWGSSLNSPVTIGTNVTSCQQMFEACTRLNSPVSFAGPLKSNVIAFGMFSRCASFNLPFNIPDGFKGCGNMFFECEKLNSKITIANTVTTCRQMFVDCFKFNQPVEIPDSVTDCYRMFFNCNHFNSPVTIGNGCTNCAEMFVLGQRNYSPLNAPVTIGDGVVNCYRMFYNCRVFDQPINLGNNVADASHMFWECIAFNKPVTLGNNLQSAEFMFYSCIKFNQPIVLPESLTFAANMFQSCNNFRSTVSVPASKAEKFTYSYLGLNPNKATIVYY